MATRTILDWVDDPSNARAWKEFAERYREMLLAWSLRHGLKPIEAEDVAQQILLRMRDKIRSYKRKEGRFRAWLKTVTYHECVDYLRKERTGKIQHLVEDVPTRDDLEQEFDRQTETELLQTALRFVEGVVSPRDFKIFLDLTFGERKAADLARELGIGIGAIQTAKYRVKQEVQLKVKELDGDND